ncbi:MAG: cytochrome c [Ferruginibacter sp.]
MRLFIIPVISVFLVLITGFSISTPHFKSEIHPGEKLYKANCRSCHKLFDGFIASPLYGAIERAPNRQWLYKYIRNSAAMLGTDSYAKCLQKKYGLAMTMFRLSDEEIDAIYAYAYSEAKKRKDVWGNKKYFISCN